jgi:hypothetical protein
LAQQEITPLFGQLGVEKLLHQIGRPATIWELEAFMMKNYSKHARMTHEMLKKGLGKSRSA